MSKKSRSNIMEITQIFPYSNFVFPFPSPPTPQRENSHSVSRFSTWGNSPHISQINGKWWLVCSGTGSVSGTRSGFGYAAYFSSTHPPVSGAPSNVELLVVVRFGNVIPSLVFYYFDFRECL